MGRTVTQHNRRHLVSGQTQNEEYSGRPKDRKGRKTCRANEESEVGEHVRCCTYILTKRMHSFQRRIKHIGLTQHFINRTRLSQILFHLCFIFYLISLRI